MRFHVPVTFNALALASILLLAVGCDENSNPGAGQEKAVVPQQAPAPHQAAAPPRAAGPHQAAAPHQAAGRQLTAEKRAEIESELAENMAAAAAATAGGDGSYYKVQPIFNPYPKPGQNWVVQNFGPVGIGITLTKPGFTMQIRNVEEGSPAAATGKLNKGQIIESINGQVLEDIDPRIILGNIITQAEATDGLVKMKIKDQGVVTVQIPVLGAYADTWPLDCAKSDKIVRNLADLLAKQDEPSWGSALFLLSTGEEKDLQVVRKWMKAKKSIGGYPWHAGYLGLAVCEYYLRTGDQSVLPMIKQMTQTLKGYMYNGGWSGRGAGPSFTYSTGTGQMHAAGVHCITFLQLAKMCGVDVDDYTFSKSLQTFYRFAGHENVPYGDGWPEGGFRDNGKTAGLAVAMSAAAELTPRGESSVYAKARDNLAMKSFYATNWFHAAHTGGGIGEIWHNAAMSMMHERRPVQYRSFLQVRRWVMDLSRRYDGSIGIAGVQDRYDKSASEQDRSWGNYFALTYTIPRGHLQMFGAPKTQWCKSYELPQRPWGRPADDAFVSTRPVAHGPISMQDVLGETIRDDASVGCFNKIGAPDVTDQTLQYYLHHPEIGLRIATLRKVVSLGRDHLIMPLFQSDDPRLRHLGALAITGMFKGRPLPDDRLKPEMFDYLGQMIENPDESLWVTLEAMKAFHRAPSPVIARHRDTILKYMTHDDWFVRAAAVTALQPICTDPAHYKAILPLMFKTLSEFTTAAPLNAAAELGKKLRSASPPVQAFALEELKNVYDAIPEHMRFPGGQVVKNGADVVRTKIAYLLEQLPGGTAYVQSRPLMTLAAARSGKAQDKYRYSGTFTPNPQMVGTWIWVLWPPADKPDQIDTRINQWLKTFEKRGQDALKNPKDTLRLLDAGKVNGGRFYDAALWTGDMLVSTKQGEARKMILRTANGIDFLLIEKGKFNETDGSKDWHPGFHGYVRLSDVKSP